MANSKSKSPSAFTRLKNSFRSRKHERRTFMPGVDHEANLKKVEENLLNLSKISKELSTTTKKKRKAGKALQLGDRFRELQNCYEDVRKYFNEVDCEVGFDGQYNKREDEEDTGFGFKRSRAAATARQAPVDVHNPDYEPMADYTLHGGKRNMQRQPLDESKPFARSLSERKHKNVDYRMQDEIKVREEANERLQEKIKKLNDEVEDFKRKLQRETELRESAQNRLSELMGKQLKSNNPAITDLSDPDRPLILVEKFSNLYDNEWTDIIGDIEQITKNEREATTILLTVVTDTYTECYDLRHKGDTFLKLKNRFADVECKIPKVPEECSVLLKSLSETHIAGLKNAILQRQESAVDRHILQCLAQTRKHYLNKCLELCWMMVCNSPPVQLEWNYKGHSFDLSVLKPFTETGDTVEFMVWPVMFLHKGGPLLCKGVAQGAYKNQHTQL